MKALIFAFLVFVAGCNAGDDDTAHAQAYDSHFEAQGCVATAYDNLYDCGGQFFVRDGNKLTKVVDPTT